MPASPPFMPLDQGLASYMGVTPRQWEVRKPTLVDFRGGADLLNNTSALRDAFNGTKNTVKIMELPLGTVKLAPTVSQRESGTGCLFTDKTYEIEGKGKGRTSLKMMEVIAGIALYHQSAGATEAIDLTLRGLTLEGPDDQPDDETVSSYGIFSAGGRGTIRLEDVELIGWNQNIKMNNLVTEAAAAYAAGTAYVLGDLVTSNSNIYVCISQGTSSGAGPSGTGTAITTGGVIWRYVKAGTTLSVTSRLELRKCWVGGRGIGILLNPSDRPEWSELIVRDSTFKQDSNAFVTDPAAHNIYCSTSLSIDIADSLFDGITHYGIRQLSNASNMPARFCRITNNTFGPRCNLGIWAGGALNTGQLNIPTNISKNTFFTGPHQDGACVSIQGDVIVEGNHFHIRGGGSGLAIDDAFSNVGETKAHIVNNDFNMQPDDRGGLYLIRKIWGTAGRHWTIEGNRFGNALAAGAPIYVTAGSALIRNNDFYGTVGVGHIRVRGASDVEILGNRFHASMNGRTVYLENVADGAIVARVEDNRAFVDCGSVQCVNGEAADWQPGQAYNIDDLVTNNGNIYICDVAGTSAGSGGPSGTGVGIIDNTVTWDYVRAGRTIHVTQRRNDWFANSVGSSLTAAHSLITGQATALDRVGTYARVGAGPYDLYVNLRANVYRLTDAGAPVYDNIFVSAPQTGAVSVALMHGMIVHLVIGATCSFSNAGNIVATAGARTAGTVVTFVVDASTPTAVLVRELGT